MSRVHPGVEEQRGKIPSLVPCLLGCGSLRDVDFVIGLGPSGETLTLQVSGPNASEGWRELGQSAGHGGGMWHLN